VSVNIVHPEHLGVRIEWFDFPGALEPIFRKLLEQCAWLIPRWCGSLYVRYNSDNADAVMMVSCARPYRDATIRVYPSFFDREHSEADQVEYIVHELVHLNLSEVSDWMQQFLNRHFDGSMQSQAQAELTDRNEAVTQEFARIIRSRLIGGAS
tara:strand:- start:2072 stop:2530 length:459 start_codon:yes stop_codon:yes gene_type:complete